MGCSKPAVHSTLALLPVFARLVAATRASQALWMLFLEARFWSYEHSYMRSMRGVGRSFEALALLAGSGLMPAAHPPKGYLLSTKWHH